MKKIVYIALFGLMFSCQKEEILPNDSTENQVVSGGCTSRSAMTVTDDQNSGEGSNGTGTITDPNSDRDENTRKKN
jgi:hypothetical protein